MSSGVPSLNFQYYSYQKINRGKEKMLLNLLESLSTCSTGKVLFGIEKQGRWVLSHNKGKSDCKTRMKEEVLAQIRVEDWLLVNAPCRDTWKCDYFSFVLHGSVTPWTGEWLLADNTGEWLLADNTGEWLLADCEEVWLLADSMEDWLLADHTDERLSADFSYT